MWRSKMLSVLTGLQQNHTKSVRGLRSTLSSQRSKVTELLQTSLIHQNYLNSGGRNGPFGFAVSEVQFTGTKALREYRGGEIHVLDGKISALPSQAVQIHFLGFKCIKESTSDQL